jgi:hypothetical protein
MSWQIIFILLWLFIILYSNLFVCFLCYYIPCLLNLFLLESVNDIRALYTTIKLYIKDQQYNE